jgi:hypothetical protein
MSGISTKEVKKVSVSKELKPGNVVAKINNISIEVTKNPKDNNEEFQIFMELESRPIGEDFVGFDKVFNDPTRGQYLGQTKKIKYANWPISSIKGISKKTNKPFEIIASSKILEFLQKLLTISGHANWLHENDGNFKTFTNMFEAVNNTRLLNDVYMSWCIGGTESINTKGYTTYYMYLPERKLALNPVGAEGDVTVTTFNQDLHIKKDLKKYAVNDDLENGEDAPNPLDILDSKLEAETNDEELFDMLD